MQSTTFLTIDEARAVLRLGRSKFYELVAEGGIKLTKIGRKSLVRQSDLDSYIATLVA